MNREYIERLSYYLKEMNKINGKDKKFKENLINKVRDDDLLTAVDRGYLLAVIEGITPNSGLNVERYWQTEEYKKIYRKVRNYALLDKTKNVLGRFASVSANMRTLPRPGYYGSRYPSPRVEKVIVSFDYRAKLWRVSTGNRVLEYFLEKNDAINYAKSIAHALGTEIVVKDK